jgi:hypothetical protein
VWNEPGPPHRFLEKESKLKKGGRGEIYQILIQKLKLF